MQRITGYCAKSQKDSFTKGLILIIKQCIMANYKGKIRIEGTGKAISVSAEAGNPSEARKIIQNQHNVKHWVKSPTRY